MRPAESDKSAPLAKVLVQPAENQAGRKRGDADGEIKPAESQPFAFTGCEMADKSLAGRLGERIDKSVAKEDDPRLPGVSGKGEREICRTIEYPASNEDRSWSEPVGGADRQGDLRCS